MTIVRPGKPNKAKRKSGGAVDGKAVPLARQVAALPWRMTERLEIMLVSSRETRRWIIPKGWLMAGRGASAAAAIEALEEAGLLGAIDEVPFGQFTYAKKFSRGKSTLCEVDVFPLRVTRQRGDWPEKDQRETRWFSPEEAGANVSDPELGALIVQFAAARRDDSQA
jgi:8-oxo-dGTP pyrophosphatase MutT (NUDIX family)